MGTSFVPCLFALSIRSQGEDLGGEFFQRMLIRMGLRGGKLVSRKVCLLPFEQLLCFLMIDVPSRMA